MKFQLVSIQNVSFIDCQSDGQMIQTGSDILDLIASCADYQCNRLLIHAGLLTEDFYNLKTGLAGELLQKLVNYHVTAAFILDEGRIGNGRFYEMMIESNRGRQFHFFTERQPAEQWLLALQ